MYSEFPLGEEIFLLPGPAGDLEVLTTSPAEAKAVAIICHPHPLFSGTMHNKVVSTLAKTCQELGLRTVRFNFRGVGKSTGTFAEGVGEADDLFAIIQWVQHVCPAEKIWLAGFSFGAAVSIYAATKIHVEKLISIAPPVSRFPLIKNAVVTCPWILVQGDADDIVLADEVFAWIETLTHKPTVIRMPGVGHFFHGQLLQLKQKLIDAQ